MMRYATDYMPLSQLLLDNSGNISYTKITKTEFEEIRNIKYDIRNMEIAEMLDVPHSRRFEPFNVNGKDDLYFISLNKGKLEFYSIDITVTGLDKNDVYIEYVE